MSKYIEDALRTESTEGARLRVGKCIKSFDYVEKILQAIERDVDALKKYVYYGKDSEFIDNLSLDLDLNISEENIRLLHVGLGVLTEAEEFLRPVLDSILRNKPLDKVNLKEEMGDMQWYLAIGCDVLDTTLEKEQEININKLKARYPEKFTEDLAINRDLDTERKILEEGTNEN